MQESNLNSAAWPMSCEGYYKKGCGYSISFRSVEDAKTEEREVTISMLMSLKKSAGHWGQSLLQQQRKSNRALFGQCASKLTVWAMCLKAYR